MKDNLILIGMPGAGKSTVGVILAKTLAMDFVDGDLEICKETGKTLQEILDNEGKEAFLDIENRVICGLNPHHTVVATGGSVPLEPEAMGHMKSCGPGSAISRPGALPLAPARVWIPSMPSGFPFMKAGRRSPLLRIPTATTSKTWWIRSLRPWSREKSNADLNCHRKDEGDHLSSGLRGI